MIICNAILAVCVLVLLARLGYMQMQHQEVVSSIAEMSNDVLNLSKDYTKAIETLSKALDDMLQNQNTFYNFASQRIDFNTVASQWQLAAIRPYVYAMQQEALKHDNFEEAEQCKRLMDTITELIEHKFK